MTSDSEHMCELMPARGIDVARARHFEMDSPWEWCLIVTRLATMEDVEENHYLDQEGDIIWQTQVGISHCPFCGMALEEPAKQTHHEADFRHLDLSGRHSKYH